MPPLTAPQVLDREFLEIRARILELAACLDRLDRAEGSLAGDARMDLLHQGLAAVQEGRQGRAEQVQLIFSRQYDQKWRGQFDL